MTVKHIFFGLCNHQKDEEILDKEDEIKEEENDDRERYEDNFLKKRFVSFVDVCLK